jgi:cytochrome d ubiquinol oxidase subunit II
MHGAFWVALKTEGDLAARARRSARFAWLGVAVLTVLVTVASFAVQPQLSVSFAQRPWGFIFPALALAGLAGTFLFGRSAAGELNAFLASCLYIAGMLTSAAQGVFPYVLPATTGAAGGLTIYNTAAPAYGLTVGFVWWIPGVILTAAYFVFIYRRMAGKVTLSDSGH